MNRRAFFKTTAGLAALLSGIQAFAMGEKTKALTSLDRVCIRRMILEIKKRLTQIAGDYVFETNDQETRDIFCNEVNGYLEIIKQRRGIYNYRLICDDTTNPPSTVDQNRLDGQLWIQLTPTIEYVVIDFSICPTKREDYRLEGWDYVKDPLPGYEIKS
jgi:hypothetical protein